MINEKIVEICKDVLTRLSNMDYERKGGSSNEQLIFPLKTQAKGTKVKDRVSEQELRLLFIEEFKIRHPELYYSVETPTVEKFNLGKSYEAIRLDKEGQSASIDMCIFERISDVYKRILNIEFKHKNSLIKNVGKDILKLMHEEKNGAFIQLLENTNSGTLFNKNNTGVFNKFNTSFSNATFHENWRGDDGKYIQLVIISLKEKTLIHRKITKSDIDNLRDIFFIESGCGNIRGIKGNGWGIETIE